MEEDSCVRQEAPTSYVMRTGLREEQVLLGKRNYQEESSNMDCHPYVLEENMMIKDSDRPGLIFM